MMKEFKGDFLAIGLDCKGARQNYLDSNTNVARMQSFAVDAIAERHRHWFLKKWDMFTAYLENYRQCIFYIFVYYAFMAEHRDLRHVMGIGIAVTRGSASSLSFCYSLLLLTVSRNLITKMKEWAFNQYIPSTPTSSSTRSWPAPPSSSPCFTRLVISATSITCPLSLWSIFIVSVLSSDSAATRESMSATGSSRHSQASLGSPFGSRCLPCSSSLIL